TADRRSACRRVPPCSGRRGRSGSRDRRPKARISTPQRYSSTASARPRATRRRGGRWPRSPRSSEARLLRRERDYYASCRTFSSRLKVEIRPRERRMHEIRHVGEHRVDAVDLAVPDLARLAHPAPVRPHHHRAPLASVGQRVAIERIRVVEEAGRNDALPPLADQRDAPLANALVDPVDAEPKLLLAALRDAS